MVHAVVGFEGDQHYARPRRHVTVVSHINEQLLQRLISDPLVEDFDEAGGIDLQVAFHQELYVDVL